MKTLRTIVSVRPKIFTEKDTQRSTLRALAANDELSGEKRLYTDA